MNRRTDPSHLWIGVFTDQAPQGFFVQQRGDDDDADDNDGDVPRSAFAASQGVVGYDLDFVEISYLSQPVPVATLVEGHSYWEQYIDPVLQWAAHHGVTEANVLVLASEKAFASPRDAAGEGYRLFYVGRYDCKT